VGQGKYMNEVDEIKERINIVDLVGQYLTLQKAGSSFKAPCPFHQEKTPSFMVNPERQMYKCFGCGEGGDVIAFVMKMENLNFPEALEMLADRAGVTLERKRKTKEEHKKEVDLKSAVYKINLTSALVWHKILLEHKLAQGARDYLNKRKINKEIIEQFKIGYAPRTQILADFLRKRGYNANQIRSAGSPERFFDRIMFPIFDTLGNVVGFTGRTLSDEIQPKYLNTPESIVFHKSRIIYGLNFAKDEIKEKKCAIVLEGQMDVVLSHIAGVNNVVASSGTALTAKHLEILSRYAPKIALCFDTDKAGITAQEKAIMIGLENDISTDVIIMPEGYKDVGEIVEKDPAIWQEYAKKTKPAMEWLIESEFNKYDRDLSSADKKTIVKKIVPFIANMRDAVEQDFYKKLFANRLATQLHFIDEAISKMKRSTKFEVRNSRQFLNFQNDKQASKNITTEDLLMGMVLANTQFVKIFCENIQEDDIKEDQLRAIYKIIKNCYNDSKNEHEVTKCITDRLKQGFEKKAKFLIMDVEEEFKELKEFELKNQFYDLINMVKEKRNKLVKNKFATLIAQAESKKDIRQVKNLIQQLQEEISQK
jgi:DNA primase